MLYAIVRPLGTRLIEAHDTRLRGRAIHEAAPGDGGNAVPIDEAGVPGSCGRHQLAQAFGGKRVALPFGQSAELARHVAEAEQDELDGARSRCGGGRHVVLPRDAGAGAGGAWSGGRAGGGSGGTGAAARSPHTVNAATAAMTRSTSSAVLYGQRPMRSRSPPSARPASSTTRTA